MRMVCLKVKETLWVLVPGRCLDIEVVAPEVLIVSVAIVMLFRNVRFYTAWHGKLVFFLFDRTFIHIFRVLILWKVWDVCFDCVNALDADWILLLCLRNNLVHIVDAPGLRVCLWSFIDVVPFANIEPVITFVRDWNWNTPVALINGSNSDEWI